MKYNPRAFDRAPGIYQVICHANGRCYIGQSRNLKQRVAHVATLLRHNKHINKELQADFNKHESSFEVTPIEYAATELLDYREIYHIARSNKDTERRCYNIAPGGCRVGIHMNPQTVSKIRMSNTGQKRSAETVKHMSEVQRQLKHARVPPNQTGFKHSPETRRLISLAGSRRILSMATLEKMKKSSRTRATNKHTVDNGYSVEPGGAKCPR